MPGMVAHTCKIHTQEAEARRYWVWGQPGIHSKTMSQMLPHLQKNLNHLQLYKS
jgi:hypothetical protein